MAMFADGELPVQSHGLPSGKIRSRHPCRSCPQSPRIMLWPQETILVAQQDKDVP